MRFPFFILFFCACIGTGSAQSAPEFEAIADSILREGIALYDTRMAEELALQVLTERLSSELVTDYVTIATPDGYRSLFFSDKGKLLYEISFLGIPSKDEAAIIRHDRKPDKYEKLAYKMVLKAQKLAASKTKFFVPHPQVQLFPILQVTEQGYSVFLLPNSVFKSLVPMGGDYRLDFSRKGKLKKRSKLHLKLIPVESKPLLQANEEAAAGIHTHAETGSPFITSTDICTLLLYRDFVDWQYHVVLSDKYASVFSITNELLLIQTVQEFEQGL